MKKLTCLLLALVLVCGCVGALAAGSKSTGSMTSSTTNSSNYDAVAVTEPDVGVGSNVALTEAQKQLVDTTLAAIAGAANPVAYFGDAVKAEIAALLPGVNVDTLQLNELTAISVKNYSITNGSLTVNCVFPTKYTAGQKVVVMIGVQQNGTVSWMSFAGTVLNDGSVSVTLPADVLLRIQNGNAVIAVLND